MYTLLKRLLTFTICVVGSGATPLLALFALKDAIRLGSGLAVLSSWLLALLALLVVGIAWVCNARLGKLAAIAACACGVTALLAYPMAAALAGQGRWLSEFTGALGMELLSTFPCIVLAMHLAWYHASKGEKSAA